MHAPSVHLMRRLARQRFQDFVLRAPRRYAVARYERFIDGMCAAVCAAWSQWQSQAVLSGVVIEGAIARGGKVLGPAWTPLMLARAPKEGPWERVRARVIATTLGEVWNAYLASIWVPELTWYPALGAVANVPAPLRSLGQATACLDTASLVSRMALALGKRRKGLDSELLVSLAEAFVQCFRRWQATTMVTNVMGTAAEGAGVMKPGGLR